MSDIGASIIAKLRNKSKETGRSLQLCLQLFCQEEFLRKLELSKYIDNLVLKGGLFIYTLTGFESRATVDIDFLLKHIPNSPGKVEEMVSNILMSDTGNDFVTFEIKSTKPIALNKKYNGICVELVAKIKNTKTPFHIDFGVGDIIIPKQEKRKIVTQLEGFKFPEINTYSLESTIAEKLDAIISRLELTSRMKDYYDIYYLANSFEFEGRSLQEAIYSTLQNRGTVYEKDTLEIILSFSHNEDMIKKWRAFLKRIQVPNIEFSEVIEVLVKFLIGVYEAIISEEEFFGKWNCEKWK